MLDIITLQYMNKTKAVYLKLMAQISKKYSLTSVECDVILFIYRNPTLNTAGDIVKNRMIDKSNVSTSIDSLRKKDLLFDEVDINSRRVKRLFLKDSATNIAKELLLKQEEFRSIYENNLTQEEIKTLIKLLDKIGNNMDDILSTV